ncbi:MAG TPA: hypothetical protein VL463_31675 [Kofleriaceae bacterium]|nr:hypothetical protein [Kofleriaceae bacterium]
MNPAPDDVRTKFRDAALCVDRRDCPPLDELRRQVVGVDGAAVAAVALEIMADPASRTDEGAGKVTKYVVEDWFEHGLDEASRARAGKALEQVVAHGSTFMRTQAYDFLAGWDLPGAEKILIAEVENPARDGRERIYAGRAIGLLEKDLSLVHRWFDDDQPNLWLAGLALMKTIDPEGNELRWDERRALVVQLGNRPSLPADVVNELAFFYEVYLDDNPKDGEIRALAERWAKHPDPEAAAQMKKAMLPRH